jgi:hypothetical protein
VSTRRELISNALQARLRELSGERIPQLIPARYGAMAAFVSQVQRQFREASSGTVHSHTADSWMSSELDCLSSLQTLCLEGELKLCPAKRAPIDTAASFVKTLDASRSDPEVIFDLLTDRYNCPLNFALPAEEQVREYLLKRLMVHYRLKVENGVHEAIDGVMLLSLTLVAVNALLTADLRFLDALNYYYESVPPNGWPDARHNWLLVSYLVLYGRALSTSL